MTELKTPIQNAISTLQDSGETAAADILRNFVVTMQRQFDEAASTRMRENLSITRAGIESQLRSTALYGAYKEPMMALGGVYNERRLGEGKPRGTVSSTKSF